jgi:hypothetical protein
MATTNHLKKFAHENDPKREAHENDPKREAHENDPKREAHENDPKREAHENDPCFLMLKRNHFIVRRQDHKNFKKHVQYFQKEEEKLGDDDEGKGELTKQKKNHLKNFEKEANELEKSQKKEVTEFVEKWYVDQALFADYELHLEQKRIVSDDTVRRGIQLQYEFENPEKDHDEAWALIVDVTQAALKECRARHALRIKNLSRTK